nr:MAG: hypothetical protein [Molluscum contagiosum virus]
MGILYLLILPLLAAPGSMSMNLFLFSSCGSTKLARTVKRMLYASSTVVSSPQSLTSTLKATNFSIMCSTTSSVSACRFT